MKIVTTLFSRCLLSALVVASGSLLVAPPASAANPIPDDCRTGPFAVGAQAYTFNRFTVMEAIEKTAAAGGKIIEFYPGQRLSKESPDARFDHNSSEEIIVQVEAQLKKFNVRAVNYGVVGISKDEAEARKVFAFAKRLGLYAVTTESADAIDTIEKMVREFDIKVGYHQHAKNPNRPEYKVWDPKFVLSLVKDRDPRIGAASDTGHWITSGLDPIESLRLLQGRIVSLHLKDRPVLGEGRPDVVFGTGVGNVKGVLDELRRQKFDGNISIEYENNWENSVPDVAQCVGFVRGYAAGLR